MTKPSGRSIAQIWNASGILLCCIATSSQAIAQVIPDTTLPVNSQTTTGGNTSIITGGTVAGGNLFHSFEQFSVPTGNVAYFNNALDIQNIISRVTGTSASNIDGKLQANGGANLFLLNPRGIIFGPNASLDIGGSFVASTASSLNFADGKFSATPSQTTPLLSVNVPIGLQFGDAKSIRVQGDGQSLKTTDWIDINALTGKTSTAGSPVQPNQTSTGLQVKPDRTLALVGGDIALEGGTLQTSGGRIELGSVADSSFVSLSPTDRGFALGYEGVQNFRDISLSGQAAVDASGIGGGNIQVRGRRVAIADGSQIEASTLGSNPGSTLNVTASESVEVAGTSTDGKYFSGLIARVDQDAIGAGGNLTINTGRLSVRDGAVIATSTRGKGQGGNLNVKAEELMDVSGISANGQIPSGLFTTTEKTATGAGGNLTIETGRLSVKDGAVVVTATTSQGDSGNLQVKAAQSVQISGISGSFISFLSAATRNTGKAGDLTIETRQLTVRDQARVTVASFGSGEAGNLQLTANSINLDNGSSISAGSGGGNGGNIQLQVQDLLLLQRNSGISTKSGGNGGNITIDTDILAAAENSTLNANAVGGKGGNVQIATKGFFISPNSQITATSEQGPQFDGIVEIDTPEIELNSDLANLPTDLVDVSGLIAQGCPAAVASAASQFVVSGRGGLPPNPRESLASESPLVDLGTSVSGGTKPVATTKNSTSGDRTVLVEAQGWAIGAKGEVILTASTPTVNPVPWQMPTSCQVE
jgi:filamentous hemagglutinin family protein